MDKELECLLKRAKISSREMMKIDTNTKNKALQMISLSLKENIEYILEENKKDMDYAEEKQMSKAMKDRLLLTKERILSISNDVLKLIDLQDPIGEIIREIKRPNGLFIQQIRVPIGVFGVIYEARPNVTVDIACLCLKSSNVCVLKGGKEAYYSNKALTSLMQKAIKGILPDYSISLIENNDHMIVDQLLKANEYVDVIVPRGGAGLIQHVVHHASVPVIETGAGNCHLYIDKDADLKKAIDISINAKIQRPSVCNAVETILVHKDIANDYLLALKDVFSNVEIRGDEYVCQVLQCKEATIEDYATEYDDYIVAIKVVSCIEEAVEHIYQYSTKHSESIITENEDAVSYFFNSLDSSCLYHNASTRFSDGGEFGFGAELGISTQKLHARGPLGLREMTSFQYRIKGNGQIRK